MTEFKITYTAGFEIIEAKSFWDAVAITRRTVRRTFQTVLAIEAV